MGTNVQKARLIFGGAEGWKESDWTASDDRVRGGSSQSHLSVSSDGKVARFYGNLDTKTLGGAGFASQRTVSDDLELDLSEYAGILLSIGRGDDKRYTFNLKDNLQPPDETTGRERSTISFECDFSLPPDDGEPADDPGDNAIFIPWDAFTPTYRGRPRKDAEPIDLKSIKRMSIMVRSFFAVQEGDFSLCLKSISAVSQAPPPMAIREATSSPSSLLLDEKKDFAAAVAAATDGVDARVLEDGMPPAAPGSLFSWIVGNNNNRNGDHRPRRRTRPSAFAITLLTAAAIAAALYWYLHIHGIPRTLLQVTPRWFCQGSSRGGHS